MKQTIYSENEWECSEWMKMQKFNKCYQKPHEATCSSVYTARNAISSWLKGLIFIFASN